MYTKEEVEELLNIVRLQSYIFISTNIDDELLSPTDQQLLQRYGIDIQDLHQEFTPVDEAFRFGMLSEIIGDSNSKQLQYDDFSKFLRSGGFIPLNEEEKYVLDYVKKQTYTYVKSLSDTILEALMEMGYDFKDNQYSDKIDVTNPNNFFVYYFENGSKLYISNFNRLTYEKVNPYDDTITAKSVIVNMSETYQFLDLITHFAKCSSKRDHTKFKQEYKSSKPNQNYTEEQLKYQEQFKKLKDVNDRRMEQLNKMSKSDPDRIALVNEVNVVKRKMKDAYEKSGLTLEKATK